MDRNGNCFVDFEILVVRLDIGLVRSMGLCASACLSNGADERIKVDVGKTYATIDMIRKVSSTRPIYFHTSVVMFTACVTLCLIMLAPIL